MRATLLGLSAAGLFLFAVSSATAGFGGFSGRSGGMMMPFPGHGMHGPMMHGPNGQNGGRFVGPLGLRPGYRHWADSNLGGAWALAGQTLVVPGSTEPEIVVEPVVIPAPSYVPPAPPSTPSGPKIIQIGAPMHTGKLPVVIYGTAGLK
jgi:hypothetical protein